MLDSTCFHNVQVSWVRRIFYVDLNDTSQERQELQLLTVGTNTFVADLRYLVDLQFPNTFRLQIRNVTKRYEGIYECQVCTKHNKSNLWLNLWILPLGPDPLQISTHPPKVIQFYLHVKGKLSSCRQNRFCMKKEDLKSNRDCHKSWGGIKHGKAIQTNFELNFGGKEKVLAHMLLISPLITFSYGFEIPVIWGWDCGIRRIW